MWATNTDIKLLDLAHFIKINSQILIEFII